jgi:hypothetical protein
MAGQGAAGGGHEGQGPVGLGHAGHGNDGGGKDGLFAITTQHTHQRRTTIVIREGR